MKLVRDLSCGPVHVYAGKQELQQVFFNVLKNAIEAFPPSSIEKTIRTVLARHGSYVLVAVSDNGPGFPKNILQALGRETVSMKPQGSGIGLIIVREIIEAHGGHLAFQNREGGGASVIASLPIHEIAKKEQANYEKARRF